MSVALVFPGQGSQEVGMGRELAAESAAARAVFAAADETLGFNISDLCFDGPAEQLTSTQNAQPALLTMSIAVLAALLERHGVAWSPDQRMPRGLPLQPAAAAGHSLGEYSALVASGALDFRTALLLVRRRSDLMSQATEGTMAAVLGLDMEPLEKICAEVMSGGAVVVANQNAPGQLVISGAEAAVAAAGKLAKQRGAKRVMPLQVSAAFHSPLMAEAAAGMAVALRDAEIAAPNFPVISNVSATPLQDADDIREELVAQITAPVRWIDSVQMLSELGCDTFVELGTGKVLTGLIKRILPGTRLINVAGPADLAALAGA